LRWNGLISTLCHSWACSRFVCTNAGHILLLYLFAAASLLSAWCKMCQCWTWNLSSCSQHLMNLFQPLPRSCPILQSTPVLNMKAKFKAVCHAPLLATHTRAYRQDLVPWMRAMPVYARRTAGFGVWTASQTESQCGPTCPLETPWYSFD